MKHNSPIGIFDSGLGGLTVLKELKKILPKEDYIYIGDTAHVPYGNKSKESILKFSIKIIDYLQKHDIKLIIAACNTVSSLVLTEIKKKTSIHIIDVITPFGSFFKNKSPAKIGVIGTYNTIQSNAYINLVKICNPKSKVFSKACPMFVPIIETGFSQHKIAKIIGQEYLSSLIVKKIDYLVLGCTHYPLLKPMLKKLLSSKIIIVDSASITAKHTKEYLVNKKLLSLSAKEGTTQIKVTDNAQEFKKGVKIFFSNALSNIDTISI